MINKALVLDIDNFCDSLKENLENFAYNLVF